MKGLFTMKTYIGTKMINAQPMMRGAYNDYRNWSAPEGEDQAVSGYLVEYLDGGKPNDSRHAGYISWSPSEQFDAAYVEIGDVSGMPAHQQRVVAEKAELDNRRFKLAGFIGTPLYFSLSKDEQLRMSNQKMVMADYSQVLGERIAAF